MPGVILFQYFYAPRPVAGTRKLLKPLQQALVLLRLLLPLGRQVPRLTEASGGGARTGWRDLEPPRPEMAISRTWGFRLGHTAAHQGGLA